MLNENGLEWKDRVHLVYAQLVVAFRYIALGGSLVISLQAGPFIYIVDILDVLRQCFRTTRAVKPKFQRRRSIAYVVCQDYISSDDTRRSFLRRLELGIQYLGRTGETPICYTSQESLTRQRHNQIYTRTRHLVLQACPASRGSRTRDS